MNMVKCKKCGAQGKIIRISDLFYAQCKSCHKWDKFQFLGATEKGAIKEWNLYNSNSKEVIDD